MVSQALYTLTTTEPTTEQPGEYEYRTHIYLTDLNAGSNRALTHGSESAKQAVWSPDGKQIAFVRTVKGKGQVFVLPLSGGEAYQLTNLNYGATDPKWSAGWQADCVFSIGADGRTADRFVAESGEATTRLVAGEAGFFDQ